MPNLIAGGRSSVRPLRELEEQMRFVTKVGMVLIGANFLPPAEATAAEMATAVVVTVGLYEAGRRLGHRAKT
jgi:hypothetical protein